MSSLVLIKVSSRLIEVFSATVVLGLFESVIKIAFIIWDTLLFPSGV